MTAAFVVAYTQRLGAPLMLLAALDMLMIDPPPRSSMPGRKAWIIRAMLRTLSVQAKSHSSSLESSTVPWWTNPAQLNSTSIAPTDAAMVRMEAGSVTSSACASGKPASFAASRSVAITRAPSARNASAVARPIPCPAAVTKAVLPCKRPISANPSTHRGFR